METPLDFFAIFGRSPAWTAEWEYFNRAPSDCNLTLAGVARYSVGKWQWANLRTFGREQD